ncbi:MAG: tetratricopeptide repeat protein [Deltaproteobacteria bacterium]|nr:tetratricopeptide repeat protein [Deltaproteobacteria bacterium]
MSFRAVVMALGLVLLGGLPISASAEAAPTEADKVEARKHFEQGKRLFDLRHYMESIPEFEEAYRLIGDPAFLYNIAQSYRLADRPDEAIHYYNTFLKRDPNTPRREEVERRLSELQSAKAPPNQVSEPGAHSNEPAPTSSEPQAAPPPPDTGWGANPAPADPNARPLPVIIPGRAERFSRGLFFQAELGLGAVGAGTSEDYTGSKVSLVGFGALLNLRLGVFVRPRLGLYLQVSSAATTDPSFTADAGGMDVSGTASGTLSLGAFGGGLVYYLPSDWFGTAGLVFQKLGWDGADPISDTLGAALSASIGHEWRLGERSSWGVVAQLLAGGVPDNDAGDGSWTTYALCIGGVFTYN